MANSIEEKKVIVSEITEKLDRAASVILVDYRGLTVGEATQLRREMRQAGVEYKVLKNTLIKRAADELQISGLDPYLNGPTAVIFSDSDPVIPAKIMSDFIRRARKTEIKSGILGKTVINAAGVQSLSEMPPKEVVVAKLMGTINAPIANLAGVLNATLRQVVTALDAIRKQKEQA